MRKENLLLLINAVVMLLIGLFTAIMINASVLTSPEDLLFNEKISLGTETNIEDSTLPNYSIIDYKQIASNEKGVKIATVYTVKIKNSFELSTTDRSYGYIELLVGIKDDLIYVEIVSLEQTLAYVANIQKYIYTYFEGISYQELLAIPYFNAVPTKDLDSGATASTSTASIKELVVRTYELHKGIINDPYEAIFGVDYSFVVDQSFTPTINVTSKQFVYDASNTLVATRFIGVATNNYGDVEIAITVDANGEILFAEYTILNQTAGLTTSRENIALYIGTNLSDVTASGDFASGATFTLYATTEAIEAIAAVWEGAN